MCISDGLARITAYPGDVELSTRRDRQAVIVQALYSNGLTRDVTSEAKYSLADPALAKLEAGLVLFPPPARYVC